MATISTELSLAPMLKVTTPFFRMLMRKISKDVILFTEMIVSSTVIHVSLEKLQFILGFPEEHTVVQIGGSNPEEVAKSVQILKELGWKHFNLNCGCPSDRVQSGKFGAILMLDKINVANIINTVFKTTGIIISLKIRTGVDLNDSYEFFKDFIDYIVSNTPCFKFYVHARKCWLQGLSPKQNRNTPPLCYNYVYTIKREYPNIFIALNGGIKENGMELLENLDGLMIGRAAYDNIEIFNNIFNISINMKDVIKEYIEEASKYNPPKYKVLMPLIHYRKGKELNKVYKQTINEIIHNNIPFDQIYNMLEPFI